MKILLFILLFVFYKQKDKSYSPARVKILTRRKKII